MIPPRSKILVINFHSACNMGDAALLISSIRLLRATYPDPQIVVAADFPEEDIFQRQSVDVVPSMAHLIGSNRDGSIFPQIMKFLGGLLLSILLPIGNQFTRSITPRAWKRTVSAYQNAVLVVGCPGNQLFTMGRVSKPLLVSCLAVWMGLRLRKPFYVFPQSIGPLKRKWERWLVGRLYSRARLVFVRDQISLQLANEILSPTKTAQYHPDLAFDFLEPSRSSGDQIFQEYFQPGFGGTVGVTVISRMTRTLNRDAIETYYSTLSRALSDVAIQHNLQIFFFVQVVGPMPNEDDRKATQQVIDGMSAAHRHVRFVNQILSPEELLAIYSRMDLFVASRLHSAILALSSGTPALCIGYLTKTQGLLRSLGLEDWFIDIMDLTELPERIEQAWLAREGYRRQLEIMIPEIHRQTNQMIEILQMDSQYIHG